jgi:F0F1-type ATP synthase epsilon subunit
VDEKQQKLTVKIFSPYQVFFQGAAVSVSASNKTGPFDVLFNHGNFFSLLPPGIVRVNSGFENIDIEINSGVIRVSNNTVTLFANV